MLFRSCMTLLRQRETALAVTFISGLEAVFGRSFVHGFLLLIKFYSLMLMACSRCLFFSQDRSMLVQQMVDLADVALDGYVYQLQSLR